MEDKGQVTIKLTTEATISDTKHLGAKFSIQGNPSVNNMLAMTAMLNAMLACEIERISSETGHPMSAFAAIDSISHNMPKMVESCRKLIRRKENAGEGVQVEI